VKLLLDTHIWLWGFLQPTRLSATVATELEDPKNELWLSPISLWELLILHKKKQLLAAQKFEEWLDKAFAIRPFREASLNFEVVREVSRLNLPHRDPADHFLVATAKVFGLTLVTADLNLQRIPGLKVMKN